MRWYIDYSWLINNLQELLTIVILGVILLDFWNKYRKVNKDTMSSEVLMERYVYLQRMRKK